LLVQILNKLSALNCLIYRSVRYFLAPSGAVNNCRCTKGAVIRESLGTAALYHTTYAYTYIHIYTYAHTYIRIFHGSVSRSQRK
jgi:hypothetical protein